MRAIVSVEDLQPPWIIDEDILSGIGAPLVMRGATVTSALKSAMLRHGILSVRVRTEEEKKSRSEEILPKELRLKVRQSVLKLVEKTVKEGSISPKSLFGVLDQTALVVDAIFSREAPVFTELRSLSSYDAYTYEHSWSVMLLSVVLGRAAWESGVARRLDHNDRVNLGMGGVLHDIGKTLVPASILNKPGELDPNEWAQMRLHPQNGFDLLRPYNLITPMVRAIVAFHHERPDGSGYGLAKGATLDRGEIPQIIRMVSIADAYDAMTTSRPYRKGRLPFEALRILSAGAGSQFDADLVGLMEHVVLPFPEGSLLLLKDGSVASVTSSGGLGVGVGRTQPECMVVACFFDSGSDGTRRIGELFILVQLSEVVLGAASPDDLVGRILEEAERGAALAPLSRLSLRSALPLWDEIFTNAVAKGMKNRNSHFE